MSKQLLEDNKKLATAVRMCQKTIKTDLSFWRELQIVLEQKDAPQAILEGIQQRIDRDATLMV